ncbi:MAG: UDP-N-acetylglucosamine 2-epimerase (non-hydrolyzing) [Anaerolineales bacterium]|jgi:UDP-N-acetylglucosamine 2-epimerase (non-hydrolysing)
MKNHKSQIVNRKLKVLSVFGTRPEAVKMAQVVQQLASTPDVDSRVCVTAQHRQMLDQVLNLFAIQPDYDLDLMHDDQSLAELSAAIFTHLDPVFMDYQPDWVLVQGDTTTVAITSLLAYYHRIKVGHVEAGLRTHDKWQPFPEEINRRVAGVIADLHFAPTEQAQLNLQIEGIPDEAILVTGNPVIDALQFVAAQPAPDEIIALFDTLGIGDRELILVTAHRRENFGQPLENICFALKALADRGDVEIVYPVHLNPNVQEPVRRILEDIPHITLLPPLDYLPLVHLQKRARLILTDSGGIQEEAPAFGVPVLVMREVTERPEGVAAGTLKLVGTETGSIVRQATRLLDNPLAHAEMAKAANPFGDGHAAERIVDAILAYPVR